MRVRTSERELIGMASPSPFLYTETAACPVSENLFFLHPRQAGSHPAAVSMSQA